ncbi:MAG: tRNA (adenosine(37)-N6)-threonylcarbamoyltransferase complex dimerization subunit type 1 TsaB [Fimbriimonadaceae bacterium]
MILCLSTSSPEVSLALIRNGEVAAHARRRATRGSGGILLAILEEALRASGVAMEAIELFVADVGPGGFTGVRVGVALAKAWAWSLGRPCAGLSAFDLVSSERTVALPVRRGLYVVREPGGEPYRAERPPSGAIGYGTDFREEHHPDAVRCRDLLDSLKPVTAPMLLPAYHAAPSISTPKAPFGIPGGAGA